MYVGLRIPTKFVLTASAVALLATTLSPMTAKAAAPASAASLAARARVSGAGRTAPNRAPLERNASAALPPNLANTTTADPTIPRPRTKPCDVRLFSSLTFSDFTPKPYQFVPPASCHGPWAKVILVADFGVTAGRQFDRTATIGLGAATIYFGTTAEPSRTVERTWHVERDLTDLSALFTMPQSGQISIGNVVDTTYTGVLFAKAKLQFYPASTTAPAPVVADVVIPLADPNGNPVALQTATDSLARSFVAPRTVERAYLDVIAQSQIGDEFWYTCFPNDLAPRLNNCGNTAFRETEVAVDARPAGVAPIYPWIYTGGIDPYLWRPIPGVQTLNFVPYRVDLTPFAGTLDDGASHSVALSVFNANHYFSTTANLLLFLDHDAKRPLTGALDTSSLGPNVPETVSEGGSFDANGVGSGTIDTGSQRAFALVGHVDTAHGRVRTEVRQSIAFAQHQAVTNSATSFVQNIAQTETLESDVVRSGAVLATHERTRFDWPFALDYAFAVRSDGTAAQTTSVAQGYVKRFATEIGGTAFSSTLSNVVKSADTLLFDATFAVTGHTANASAQAYTLLGSDGTCYGRTVKSANGLVTANVVRDCRQTPGP